MNKTLLAFLMCCSSVDVIAKCENFWQVQQANAPLLSANQFEKSFSEDKVAYRTVEERMKLYRVPGLSIASVVNGQLVWAKTYGIKQTGNAECIDVDTVFSVGSVSKVATAMMSLRLVQQGKLSLDNDINQYLSGWQVPALNGKQYRVNLRQIMSHTAGFNVHGFRDFQPDEAVPSTIDILYGRAPAKNIPVTLTLKPGESYRYSGGGTTVQQLMIEQRTELVFEEAAINLLFTPLNMTRSSFENPLPLSFGNIAKAHNSNGQPRALPRGYESMPEKAASGLWSSAKDLGKVLVTLLTKQKNSENTFLKQSYLDEMMTAQPNSRHGLGPVVIGDTFYHGGANDSYRALLYGDRRSGNGFVILTNSASGDHLIEEIKDAMLKIELNPEPNAEQSSESKPELAR